MGVRRPPFCTNVRGKPGCGAEITWSETEAGKRMPVDRHTSADGNVIYVNGRVRVLGPLDLETLEEGVPRFMPHFATCPVYNGTAEDES